MLLYSLIWQRAEIYFPKEPSNMCRPVESSLVNQSAKDSQTNGYKSGAFGYCMVGGFFVLSTASAQGVNVFLDDDLLSL